MQLEKYGYAIKTTSTGEKVVATMSAYSDIDLLLMNINLGNRKDRTQASQIILNNYYIFRSGVKSGVGNSRF